MSLSDSVFYDASFPFRITVLDIIATDLSSVHFLSKNCPHVNIACGNSNEATNQINGAGKSAIWNGLSLIFYVEKTDKIRISVWSHTSCIGLRVLDPNAFLECASDKTRIREMLLTVLDKNNNISGKLSLSFLIDNYSNFSVPIDSEGIIIPQKLAPPVLLTIFTVSVINLVSVHRFSKNSPVVKIICDSWRKSSEVNYSSGDNAKWENLMWSTVLDEDSPLRLVVMSGSVVIGSKTFFVQDFIDCIPDKNGFSDIQDNLVLSKKDGITVPCTRGLIRVTFSVEQHLESVTNSDNESNQVKEDLDLPPMIINVCAIFVTEMNSIQILSLNSLVVQIKCDDVKLEFQAS
jgi:hypothetical protein